MDVQTKPSYVVACMDIFAPIVQEVMVKVKPPEFDLRFVKTYDDDEQFAVAREADILVGGGGPISAAMLAQAPRVRMIQKWGIGLDKVDLDAARTRGITVAITAGANAAPVAELAIGLMLAVYRRIPFADRSMRQGQWLKAEMRGWCYQFEGKTVGLFGFGAIARMVAHRLRGFDCRIIYYDVNRSDRNTERALNATYVPFEQLLAQSDILSIHTPLTAATRNIFDAAAIAHMKDGAVIINTARGGIIDEGALLSAIDTGKLRGAGLDSFAIEPLPSDSPLLRNDRIVVTPHAGGGVLDNVENVTVHAFGNILRFLSGEPLSPADVVVAAKGSPVSAGKAHG